MDKEAVENFGKQKGILMNFVNYDDVHFDTPEFRRRLPEMEGKYGINNGILSFVVNGHYYATPNVEYGITLLENAGYVNGGIPVPFGSIGSFPGRLGHEDMVRIAGAHSNDPAQAIAQYYQYLMQTNSTYRRWKELLDEANYFGIVDGRKPTLDDEVRRLINDAIQNREEINESLLEEVAQKKTENGRRYS